VLLLIAYSIQVASYQHESSRPLNPSGSRFAGRQLGDVVTKLENALITPRFSGASSFITSPDEQCVMCQYYTQRIQSSMVHYSVQFHPPQNSNQEPSLLAIDETLEINDRSETENSEGIFLETGKSSRKLGDWSVALQKAKNTLNRAYNDDETLNKKEEVDETFYAPMSKPVSHSSSPSLRIQPAKKPRFVEHRASQGPPAPTPPTQLVGVSASRRERMIEAREATPDLLRFPARGEFMGMEAALFENFVSICGNQPLAYGKYCDDLVKQFPFVLQALHSRDTPQRVCLNLNFCTQDSYAAGAPHALEMMPVSS